MRAKVKNKKKLVIAIAVAMLPTIGIFNMMNAQKAQIAQLNQRLVEEQQKAVIAEPAATEKKEETTSNAVLAKKDINKGELITIDKVIKKEYKKEELPIGFFNNETYILGKVASDFILQGKIITADDVLDKNQNLITIPDGMRAITLPSESVQGLAPYIFVGTKIDIYTVKAPTELIAQNIEIIALESPQEPQPINKPVAPGTEAPVVSPKKNINAQQASSITLLVPVRIADKLIDSMSQGKLQFITRGKSDSKLISKNINLPPPPSSTETLPKLPVPITPPTPSVPVPPPEPESPKVAVEAFRNLSRTCYDKDGNAIPEDKCTPPTASSNKSSNSKPSSKVSSKDLTDLLKLIK